MPQHQCLIAHIYYGKKVPLLAPTWECVGWLLWYGFYHDGLLLVAMMAYLWGTPLFRFCKQPYPDTTFRHCKPIYSWQCKGQFYTVILTLKTVIAVIFIFLCLLISSFALFPQTWFDESLTWDPKAYNNTRRLVVASTKLWLPDIFIFNT